MQAKTRRVAVIGGNRIPFARSNTVYADASNQDMLTAAIDGLVARYGLEGERLGEVVAGAVLKHSRDFNLTRESVLGSQARARDPGLRHPAGLRHRHPGRDPGRQQDRARPDRGRHRRRHRHHLRRADRGQREAPQDPARGQPRQDPAGPARRRWPRSARSTSRPSIPQNSEPRTGLSMGESAALTALEWHIGREEQDELAVASHQQPRRGVRPRLPRRPGHAVPRPRARPEPARRLLAGEARHAQAGLRQGRGRHDDRRQLHAAHRRRLRRCCCARRSTPRSAAGSVLAYLTDYETAAVDYVHGGEGLLMAPAYAMPRMLDARRAHRCRTSTSTRSTRRSPRRCWPRSRRGRTRSSARSGSASTRRSARSTAQAQRRRLVAGGGSPVRGDRRPDRRHPGQAAGREGLRPRRDLDLRRRRPGRHRDPGALTRRVTRRSRRSGPGARAGSAASRHAP